MLAANTRWVSSVPPMHLPLCMHLLLRVPFHAQILLFLRNVLERIISTTKRFISLFQVCLLPFEVKTLCSGQTQFSSANLVTFEK